jgi:hypothetical protein
MILAQSRQLRLSGSDAIYDLRITILKLELAMKNRKKVAKTIVLLSFLLTSCDCVILVEGSIKDDKNVPISDVTFYSLNKTYNTKKSGVDGKFSFSEINGGVGKCSSIDLVFEKSGYKTDTITFKSGSKDVVVALKK